MVTLTRSAVLPLSVLVFGLAALTGPSGSIRSLVLILGVAAVGAALLAVTSWWQASGESRQDAGANARRVAAEDAADDARMGSDAG